MSTSKYYPIWEKLKKELRCDVAAVPALHARIKKAVVKRKDRDLAFKLYIADQGKYATLISKSEGSVIKFKLLITDHRTSQQTILKDL